MNISRWTSAFLPKRAKRILRDFFYLHLPIKRRFFHVLSPFLPPFVPIEGYLMEHMPHPGDTVIDAGPYPGNFTIILSRLVGRRGTVLAFEANKNNCHDLRMRLRKLRLKNVVVLNVALWDSDNLQVLTKREGEGSSLFGWDKNGGADTDRVSTRRLDTIVTELKISRIDYIKMDIEGAEIEAVEGATKILATQSPALVIAAYHIRNGAATCKTVAESLQRLGYHVMVGFPGHLSVYGRKNKNTG